MRKRVKLSSKAVLQAIQLAAIAISTAFQKRRALRQGMSAFIRAAISTHGTCTVVFTARSSVPKANRAPVPIYPIDSPAQGYRRSKYDSISEPQRTFQKQLRGVVNGWLSHLITNSSTVRS